jgi:hypothetical protein
LYGLSVIVCGGGSDGGGVLVFVVFVCHGVVWLVVMVVVVVVVLGYWSWFGVVCSVLVCVVGGIGSWCLWLWCWHTSGHYYILAPRSCKPAGLDNGRSLTLLVYILASHILLVIIISLLRGVVSPLGWTMSGVVYATLPPSDPPTHPMIHPPALNNHPPTQLIFIYINIYLVWWGAQKTPGAPYMYAKRTFSLHYLWLIVLYTYLSII